MTPVKMDDDGSLMDKCCTSDEGREHINIRIRVGGVGGVTREKGRGEEFRDAPAEE